MPVTLALFSHLLPVMWFFSVVAGFWSRSHSEYQIDRTNINEVHTKIWYQHSETMQLSEYRFCCFLSADQFVIDTLGAILGRFFIVSSSECLSVALFICQHSLVHWVTLHIGASTIHTTFLNVPRLAKPSQCEPGIDYRRTLPKMTHQKESWCLVVSASSLCLALPIIATEK